MVDTMPLPHGWLPSCTSLKHCTVVLGGSFNPPHMGHQAAILFLLEALQAEQVWLTPVYQHPFGKNLIPFEHRLAMCRLLAAPFAERCVVSAAEEVVGKGGTTFALMEYFTQQYPEKEWVVGLGADISREFAQWYRAADVLKNWPVVVLGRGHESNLLSHTPPVPNISSTEVRQRLAEGHSVWGWLPHSVYHYIESHKLYSAEYK
mgnify:CR=1 FL=1